MIARWVAMGIAAVLGFSLGMPLAVAAPPEDGASLLFVVRGRATADGDTVRVRTATIEWFTNRPERRAGTMSTRDLVERWADYGFESTPPNAAITSDDVDVVVELSDPDVRGGAIRFRVEPVRGRRLSGSLGRISVFVDDTTIGADCERVRAGDRSELQGAQLQWCDLTGLDLAGANLSGANLEFATFVRSNLAGADFTAANGFRSTYTIADLDDVNFYRADMRSSNLSGASITGASGRANWIGATCPDDEVIETSDGDCTQHPPLQPPPAPLDG